MKKKNSEWNSIFGLWEWSGGRKKKNILTLAFQESPRGVGWLFGSVPVKKFCKKNGMEMIVRSHQLVMEGYEYMFENSLLTIWSAPNYVNKCKNKAAVHVIHEDKRHDDRVYEASLESSKKQTFQQEERDVGGGGDLPNHYFT
eukprot:TRINITY_DN9049_c0_g3_i2.p1 TRINITY_DN9049_c0_g3~~TRINITY_DN9049_c0_g3_i2.p1  ORF type:complete len:143 (-),score=45.00 TRINITY_DN9049_c0_g3_i2:249-677(-)